MAMSLWPSCLTSCSQSSPCGGSEAAEIDPWASHEPYVAVNGYILRRAPEEERARLIGRVPDNHERGQHALAVMEQHLRANDWFVLTATRSPI